MVNDMRLINASRAIARVEEIPLLADKNQSFYEGCRYMQKRVLRIFHTSKTIDAEVVVRCKDCKHWKKGQFMGGNSIDDLEYGGSCPLARFARYESDFCSYGERKEADGNG